MVAEVIFVLGGPGTGKGTQCSKIVEHFGYLHLSAGDLLREERNSGSELAEMINTCILEGRVVPSSVTVGLLNSAMIKHDNDMQKKKFLIDGFPRNVENFSTWLELVGDKSLLLFTLFFECPEKTLEERLLQRGLTSGRNDDNIETIKKRFRGFYEDCLPVVEILETLGQVIRISSVPPIDEVFSQVSKYFQVVISTRSNEQQISPIFESIFPFYQLKKSQADVIEEAKSWDRTLAMIKPDAVQAGKEDDIIKAIKGKGFKIIGHVKKTLKKEEAEKFYAEHHGKPFFERLITFMTSGPVVALALQGQDAIKRWRHLMGPTNTEKAKAEAPQSMRALYGSDNTKNATHGSDSMLSAARELKFWFPDGIRRKGGGAAAVDEGEKKEKTASSSPNKRPVEKEKEEDGAQHKSKQPKVN